MLRNKRDMEFYVFPIKLTLEQHTVFTTINISVTNGRRAMILYIQLLVFKAEFNGEK